MTDKEKIEENIRMAEGFISEAKRCLREEYELVESLRNKVKKGEQ